MTHPLCREWRRTRDHLRLQHERLGVNMSEYARACLSAAEEFVADLESSHASEFTCYQRPVKPKKRGQESLWDRRPLLKETA